MNIPKAVEIFPTYENFKAICPHCKYNNIFNRASDIKHFRLITNLIVDCQNEECKKKFRICGDWINPKWQMLLVDLDWFKKQKEYSTCILRFCSSFEMYFDLYLRVTLVHNPYFAEDLHDLEQLNKISSLLYDKISTWTYIRLRNTFMNMLLRNQQYHTLSESGDAIKKLHLLSAKPPSDGEIRSIADKRLSKVLLELREFDINKLRNDIIHKSGYRPTLEEVEYAEDNTMHILHRINNCLGSLNDRFRR